MQQIVIDLTKSPDIADETADLQPGDEVTLHGTIQSLDDQTLVVTIQELEVPTEDNTAKEKAEPPTKSEADMNPMADGGMMGENAEVA